MMRSSEFRTPVVGGQKRRRPSGRPFRFGPGVSSPLPSTGKPVLADTSGVGNSDLVGHPSRPSLASHSRPCSLPRGRRDFRPRACNRPGRARNTDRDGRPCAAPKRALPVRKLTEQHHLKARFLTFVSPLGVPRVRVQGFECAKSKRSIRKPNSRSDLDSRNSVKWL